MTHASDWLRELIALVNDPSLNVSSGTCCHPAEGIAETRTVRSRHAETGWDPVCW